MLYLATHSKMPLKEMNCDDGQERSFNQCAHTGKNRKMSSVFQGLIGTVRFYKKGEETIVVGLHSYQDM